MELHGGFVRLASQEGAGTVVTCHIPVAGPGHSVDLGDVQDLLEMEDFIDDEDSSHLPAAE